MASNSISFFSRKPVNCPVCDADVYREELRTGRGRLNAGDLSVELRRRYIPSKKYGRVNPLNYPVTVCPSCYFAAFHEDFTSPPDSVIPAVEAATEQRSETVEELFGELDFSEPRDDIHGCASYYLAAACYEHFPADTSPTIKNGLCMLRAAWICNDLEADRPGENWAYLANVFYRKARFYYTLAVEREQSGEEAMSALSRLGPDLDKDYGYDGVLYVYGLLEFRHGPRGNEAQREKSLHNAKRTVARLFGMGKASRNKPAAILDNARELYEEISTELGGDSGEKADEE